MNIKKIAALLLSVAMLLCFAGCSSEKPTVVATYNGGEIPAGLYVFNQVTAINQALAVAGNPYSQADQILNQKIEGVSGEKWINNLAADMTKYHAALKSEVERLGLKLDDEMAAQVAADLKTNWEMDGAYMESLGVSYDAFELITTLNLLSPELFNAYYGENGEQPVPEEELKAFFLDNYRRSMIVVLPLVDSTTGAALSEAEIADTRARYEDYKTRLANGETIFDIITTTDTLMRELGQTGEETPEPVEEDYEMLFAREGSGYPTALRDAIFDENAPLNTPLFYEDENFLVIYDLRDTMGDGEVYENSKLSLLTVLKGTEFEAKLNAVADSINYTVDEKAVKALPVRNIFLQYSKS